MKDNSYKKSMEDSHKMTKKKPKEETKKEETFVVQENDIYMPPYWKYSTDIDLEDLDDDPKLAEIDRKLKEKGIEI